MAYRMEDFSKAFSPVNFQSKNLQQFDILYYQKAYVAQSFAIYHLTSPKSSLLLYPKEYARGSFSPIPPPNDWFLCFYSLAFLFQFWAISYYKNKL